MKIDCPVTVAKFDDLSPGDVFYTGAFGAMSLVMKYAFVFKERDTPPPGVLILKQAAEDHSRLPMAYDGSALHSHLVLKINDVTFRPFIDIDNIKSGTPDHRMLGAIMLHENQTFMLCGFANRDVIDINLSTGLADWNSRPKRFWTAGASVMVPADAGGMKEIARIEARQVEGF